MEGDGLMAKDDETGINPVAKDGEPNVSEIERRRQQKANGGSMAERAASEQAKLDAEPSRAAGEAGEVGEVGEEDDGQVFVWEQGRKVTLGTLISRGIPVEHAFVFGGKRLKGRGGLMGFDEDVLVVCRGKVGKTSLVPTRDDDEKVTKVTVETHIGARVVVPADSDEAWGMLAGIVEKRSAA
ncbi:MAG: hypothetical protein ACRDMZ_13480 [Solirubrobacteraceae bacterium]